MKTKTRMYIQIEDGDAIARVEIAISDIFDMRTAGTIDQVCEVYVRPAIEQVMRELQYAKEMKADLA